ncbi:MAG TPA: hypothetical protein VF795_03215 [Desulfuromonadaceae bacterium]
MERVNAPIRVAVVFGPGRQIRPVWFDWQHRKRTVTELAYGWESRAGRDILLHFSVSDGSDLFELVYNTADQSWTLESVEAH